MNQAMPRPQRSENTTSITVGIDVSKDYLDVATYPAGETTRVENVRKGHAALLRWVGQRPVARVVFEATGYYHRALEQQLLRAGVPFAVVNPRQARRFAEATGKLAKTDRADALLLARFGALIDPQDRSERTETQAQLAELTAARRVLLRDRTAILNRIPALTVELLKRHARHRLRQIEAHLNSVDAAIDDIIGNDPALARRFAILMSIPGLGRITAYALLADMPELGSLEPRQAASLAGLAPVTRQSGLWCGKSSIRGGRAQIRRALYMPALVATRFNPDLKRCYDNLIARGKHAKLAITAVMRRLLVLANTLLQQDRIWTEKCP